jgi:hypothetical protein
MNFLSAYAYITLSTTLLDQYLDLNPKGLTEAKV